MPHFEALLSRRGICRVREGGGRVVVELLFESGAYSSLDLIFQIACGDAITHSNGLSSKCARKVESQRSTKLWRPARVLVQSGLLE